MLGALAIACIAWRDHHKQYGSDNSSDNTKELIDTSSAMPGVDQDRIDDRTRAAILTEQINNKLNENADYGVNQAIADYDNVYRKSNGELKIYVAIEYAHYVYVSSNDIDRAVKIMTDVENSLSDDNKLDYYTAMLNLYTHANDSAMKAKYQKLVDDSRPNITTEELVRNAK